MSELSAHPGDARLLAFIAPGLTHALGNQLFAIRSAGLLLGHEGAAATAADTMRQALNNADSVLDICRLLSEPRIEPKPGQPGPLLDALAPLCRVPLRDRSLRLAIDHGSSDAPLTVDAACFVRGVLELMCCVVEGLPEFVDGTLHIDPPAMVDGRVALSFRVESTDALLPFPLQLPGMAERANAALERVGVRVEAQDPATLWLLLPPL